MNDDFDSVLQKFQADALFGDVDALASRIYAHGLHDYGKEGEYSSRGWLVSAVNGAIDKTLISGRTEHFQNFIEIADWGQENLANAKVLAELISYAYKISDKDKKSGGR